jgi:DNA-binding MarR family transcriptional regulator
MVKILVQNAAKVFSSLPAETSQTQPSNPTMALFQALSQQFEKSRYNEIAEQLQIPESTTNKWLTKFVNNNLLIKQAHGSYTKKDT